MTQEDATSLIKLKASAGRDVFQAGRDIVQNIQYHYAERHWLALLGYATTGTALIIVLALGISSVVQGAKTALGLEQDSGSLCRAVTSDVQETRRLVEGLIPGLRTPDGQTITNMSADPEDGTITIELTSESGISEVPTNLTLPQPEKARGIHALVMNPDTRILDVYYDDEPEKPVTTNIEIPSPRGIVDLSVNDDGFLQVMYTDNPQFQATKIELPEGQKGDPGTPGTNGVCTSPCVDNFKQIEILRKNYSAMNDSVNSMDTRLKSVESLVGPF